MLKEQKFFSVGLKALIINDKGEVLITKRSKHVPKAGFYDLPGGRMELGETLRTALSREVTEEVGLKVEKIFAPVAITTFIRNVNSNNQIVRIIFPCTASGKIKPQDFEVADFRWIKLGDYSKFGFADEDFPLAFERCKNIDFKSETDFIGIGALEDSLKMLV